MSNCHLNSDIVVGGADMTGEEEWSGLCRSLVPEDAHKWTAAVCCKDLRKVEVAGRVGGSYVDRVFAVLVVGEAVEMSK